MTADGKVLLRYRLWDTNQKPVYQKCADAFQQAEPEHPDPDREQELGRLLERARPRLHRRHRARRVHRPPRQVPAVRAERGDRAGQHARRRHEPVPARAWPSCGSRPSGKQYGFPKDWDTVALVVNEDMLAKAGVTKQQLDTATWNPTDGGTFEQIVAKLTRRQQRQARRRARLRPEATSRSTGSASTPAASPTGRRRGPASPPASASSCSTRTRGARSTTTTTRASRRRSPGGAT